MQLIRRLAIALGIVFLVFLAAVWYDEAPDADMLRQWESRPQVADEDNLFLAMIGADIATDEPPHVAGRRILENPVDEKLKRIEVSEGNREFIGWMSTVCRAITAESTTPCLFRHLPENRTQAAEQRMAERYRALRRYTAYRSELRSDGKLPARSFTRLHASFIATHLAVDSADAIPVEELVMDTRFLREALAASDSLLERLIVAATLERNYRLVVESIEAGNAKQAAALRDVLLPLPAQALDLSGVLTNEYLTKRNEYKQYRQALIRGEDPLLENYTVFNEPSPFPASAWQRRIKALWFKPEMTANANLARSRNFFGIPHARSDSFLQRGVDATINATGMGFLSDYLDGNGGASYKRKITDDGNGWRFYKPILTDLDYYIRLIALVGTLTAQEGFDPVRVVADWNAKLSTDAQDYRLSWDEKRSAYSFNPKSVSWQGRAKTAGHGVLVRVPPYLVQEVDVWRGISARCKGTRCELLAEGRAPIVAELKINLQSETDSYSIVREVVPGKYVGIGFMEQDFRGDWSERRIRVRAVDSN